MDPKHSFYIPPQGPPQGILPNPEIYAKMGEENVFLMLEDFYLVLEKSSIRHLFPEDMVKASKKSATFFVFILGGPPLYQQIYGPPSMRKRHLPFAIDENARQIWLDSFRKILENADKKYSFPLEHLESFWNYLEKFSAWMINSK
jgi:hemoglobin